MKFKEFIKPNTFKLLITIILIIFIPFVYYTAPCSKYYDEINPYVGISIEQMLNLGCGISFMNISKFFSISKYSVFYNLLLFFIIHILLSYLFSCTLIYSYNKFIKK